MASDSTRWAAFFAARADRPLDAPFASPLPERPGRAAVARSVARFELGESGDGERLRRCAAQLRDADYLRAIELFVREENHHARWLGLLRERFGGEPVTAHWSDRAFVRLRHAGGLRLELGVLLAAEVVALGYFRVLPLAYADPALTAACRRILADERGHVAFHRATLARLLPGGPARVVSITAWRAFTAVAAAVVAWDHGHVLGLAGVTRAGFVRETWKRTRALGPAAPGRAGRESGRGAVTYPGRRHAAAARASHAVDRAR